MLCPATGAAFVHEDGEDGLEFAREDPGQESSDCINYTKGYTDRFSLEGMSEICAVQQSTAAQDVTLLG